MEGSADPDEDYNLLIRPWKSRLGLIYIEQRTFFLDIKLIFLTVLSFINKKYVLKSIHNDLRKKKTSNDVLAVVLRKEELKPAKPPQ